MCTQRRARVCADSIAPMAGPGAWLWQVPVSDFGRSVPAALWSQQLRDIQADCLHSLDWDGAPGSTNSSVLCEPTQPVTDDTTELTFWWTAPAEEYLVEALQFHLPHTTLKNWIWGLLFQQLGSRSCPWQGCDSHRAKRRPHSISSTGSGHHNTSHTTYQRDSGQHTLRKETAGIHTKNSPHTKNIRLMQAPQECFHIKTALKDQSR